MPIAKSTTHKTADQIIVSANDINDRPYTSLGDITVTVRKANIMESDPTQEMVKKALQEKAADMGADAVVLVRYGTVGIGLISWGQMDGSGRAIVFK